VRKYWVMKRMRNALVTMIYITKKNSRLYDTNICKKLKSVKEIGEYKYIPME
jgi:hypothetical protein